MRPVPDLKIEETPVETLVPYANNAKIHTRKQVDQIAASISEFGNCDPIAVWHNENGEPEIVEGHGRVLALKQLGIETAPVISLDHLTDEQRRAYTHVHNQTTLSSGFDYETLTEDMDNLNADWESFGFDEYLYKGASVDAIEDLMTEDFATNATKGNGDTFSFSLVFPIDVKDSVEAYVKAIGRDELSARIIKEAEEWE